MPSQILAEHWYAKTYGWPPDVTRRQPLEVAQWFPAIAAAEQEVSAKRQREAERAQKRAR